MAKNLRNYHFEHIFVINDPLNLRSKKSKFYSHNFLGNIFVHIHAKHRKDRMKIEEVYSIWKKVDRQTDRRTARHRISSADYVSSGVKSGIRDIHMLH